MRKVGPQPFNTFDEVAASPFFWWMQAQDLLMAAYAVLDAYKDSCEAYFGSLPKESGPVKLSEEQAFHGARIGIGPVFPFLMGLALENKVKGILVARDSSLATGGQLSPNLAGSHDLPALFAKLGFDLTADDRDLLSRLGEAVSWAGRYPVPKREEARMLRLIPGKGWAKPGTILLEDEARKIAGMWKRLEEAIESDPRCPKYHSWRPEDDHT